jgi:hypothetical protein
VFTLPFQAYLMISSRTVEFAFSSSLALGFIADLSARSARKTPTIAGSLLIDCSSRQKSSEILPRPMERGTNGLNSFDIKRKLSVKKCLCESETAPAFASPTAGEYREALDDCFASFCHPRGTRLCSKVEQAKEGFSRPYVTFETSGKGLFGHSTVYDDASIASAERG